MTSPCERPGFHDFSRGPLEACRPKERVSALTESGRYILFIKDSFLQLWEAIAVDTQPLLAVDEGQEIQTGEPRDRRLTIINLSLLALGRQPSERSYEVSGVPWTHLQALVFRTGNGSFCRLP